MTLAIFCSVLTVVSQVHRNIGQSLPIGVLNCVILFKFDSWPYSVVPVFNGVVAVLGSTVTITLQTVVPLQSDNLLGKFKLNSSKYWSHTDTRKYIWPSMSLVVISIRVDLLWNGDIPIPRPNSCFSGDLRAKNKIT